MKKILIPILCIILLLTGCSYNNINENYTNNQNIQENLAEVHFIDVGQADATLIISNNETILIDTGDIETSNEVVKYIKKLGVEKIDYLVLTHPHSDHIGGAPEVISTFKIGKILMPDKITTSDIFEKTIDTIDIAGYSITIPNQGETYNIGNGTFTILTDQKLDWKDDLNAYSLGVKVTFGENDLIFTGDIEEKGEKKILEKMSVDAEILKIGHHGSDTSTCNDFLNAVSPEIAIISCGEGNSYGHPHSEIIKKLENNNILYYRTDIEGTIILNIGNNSVNINNTSINISNNSETTEEVTLNYIININSKKIHLENCNSVTSMSEKNKEYFSGNIDELLNNGYEKCKNCLE